jgi:hypothetical protein
MTIIGILQTVAFGSGDSKFGSFLTIIIFGGLVLAVLVTVFIIFLLKTRKKYRSLAGGISKKQLRNWTLAQTGVLVFITALYIIITGQPAVNIPTQNETVANSTILNAEQTSQKLNDWLISNGYSIETGDDSPPNELEGYDFYTYASKGYSAAVTNGDGYNYAFESLSDKLTNELQKLGFTTYSLEENVDGLFSNGKTLCEPNPFVKAVYSCADFSEYESMAKEMQPFVTLIPASNWWPGLLFNLNAVENSSISGYQHVTLSSASNAEGYFNVSGYDHLFYRFNPASNQPDWGWENWQYFDRTASEFLCSKFNTVDLQKAFADSSCQNENGEFVKVSEYYNLSSETIIIDSALQKALLDKYLAKVSHSDNDIIVESNGKLTNSRFKPYQYLQVDMYAQSGGGWVAVYYRNGENDTWEFAIAGQEAPSCTEITSDARYALADFPCYSGQKTTTVSEYYKL